MLHRDERDVDPGHAAELARPLAGADHELLAGDPPVVGDDRARRAALDLDAGDRHALADFDAGVARALGEGLVMSEGEACPSVGRKAAPTTSSTCISGHRSCASLGVRRCISRPKDVRRGRLPLHLGPALRIAGEAQPAVPLPAGREAGLLLEPVVELDGIAEKLGDVGTRAQLADEARGVPGRAARSTCPRSSSSTSVSPILAR